jgi:protein O-mannosyl-transferase
MTRNSHFRARRRGLRIPRSFEFRTEQGLQIGHVAVLGALILATVLCFADSLTFTHLIMDDSIYLGSESPLAQRAGSWFGIAKTVLDFRLVYWQPVTLLTFWVLDDASPNGVRIHHFFNLVLHCVCGLIAYAISRGLELGRWVSSLTVILAVCHPVRTEAVVWISGRRDLLASVFSLAALYFCVQKDRPVLFWVFGLLAVSSKPSAMLVPLVCIVISYMIKCRQHSSGFAGASAALIGIGAGIAAIAGQTASGALSMGPQPKTILEGIARVLSNYAEFVRLLVFPVELSCFYPATSDISIDRTVVGLICLMLTCCGGVIAWRTKSIASKTGWLWWCVTIIPVIGAIQAGAQSVADRFLYIPMWGFMWWCAGLLSYGGQLLRPASRISAQNVRSVAFAAFALCLFWYVTLSMRYTQKWANAETVLANAIEVKGDHWFLNGAIAGHYLRDRKYELARLHYSKASTARVEDPGLSLGLAASQLALRDFKGAVASARSAVGSNPIDSKAWMVMATAQLLNEETAAGIGNLSHAVTLGVDPCSVAVRLNDFGARAATEDRYRDALLLFQAAVEHCAAMETAKLNLERVKADLALIRRNGRNER